MKLQKALSRKVKGKKYPKWIITVPPNQVKELGWDEGEELESKVENRKLILRSSGAKTTRAETK